MGRGGGQSISISNSFTGNADVVGPGPQIGNCFLLLDHSLLVSLMWSFKKIDWPDGPTDRYTYWFLLFILSLEFAYTFSKYCK